MDQPVWRTMLYMLLAAMLFNIGYSYLRVMRWRLRR